MIVTCLILSLAGKSSGMEAAVNPDDIACVVPKPVPSVSLEPSSSPYCNLFRPDIVPENMKMLGQKPDGSDKKVSFPLSITPGGKIIDSEGANVLNPSYKPIKIPLPLPPVETLTYRLNKEVVRDNLKNPPLVLAEYLSFSIVTDPSALLDPPASEAISLPNAIAEERKKEAMPTRKTVLAKIALYPSQRKLENQFIQLFVGQDLLQILQEWIHEDDYAYLIHHIQDIALPCFGNRRCPLEPLYRDKIIARLVTDLVTYQCQPTELLDKIIKHETTHKDIKKDVTAIAQYLREAIVFDRALRFAHKHQYGLSIVLLLVLSSISDSYQQQDRWIKGIARNFIFQCHKTRYPIRTFFRNIFKQRFPKELYLFATLRSQLTRGRAYRL